MDVFLRGLCEQHVDNMLGEQLIQEIRCLVDELDIPEGSRDCFLLGYFTGSACSKLKNYCLAMFDRLPENEEIQFFNDVLKRRMPEIHMILCEQYAQIGAEDDVLDSESLHGEPEDYEPSMDEELDPVPLRPVATIDGSSDSGDEEKFSFQITGKKKAVSSILGIPIRK